MHMSLLVVRPNFFPCLWSHVNNIRCFLELASAIFEKNREKLLRAFLPFNGSAHSLHSDVKRFSPAQFGEKSNRVATGNRYESEV